MSSDPPPAAVNVGVPVHTSSRILPDFLQSVNLKYVKLGYHYLMTHLLALMLILLVAVIFVQASQTDDLNDLRNLSLHLQYNLVAIIVCSVFLVFGSTVYIMMRPRSVYLVDFSCYLPPPHLQAKFSNFMEQSRLTGDFEPSSLVCQCKIPGRSGLGEETCVP
ncbi:hypothetical protein K1719_002468 [Acacia pycnantha]|nr:hypothetical protein K1719_002468 [Acacia pycnantha]